MEKAPARTGKAKGLAADYERKGRRAVDSLDSRLKVLEAELGAIRALDFGPADIDYFIEAREEVGLRPASINRYLETIRRALNLGHRRRWVVEPTYVEMLPVNNERNEDLSPAEYRELLSVLREPVRLMFVIAYHIGWRAAAIKSLEWPQVDIEGGVIHARRINQARRLAMLPSTSICARSFYRPVFVETRRIRIARGYATGTGNRQYLSRRMGTCEGINRSTGSTLP